MFQPYFCRRRLPLAEQEAIFREVTHLLDRQVCLRNVRLQALPLLQKKPGSTLQWEVAGS